MNSKKILRMIIILVFVIGIVLTPYVSADRAGTIGTTLETGEASDKVQGTAYMIWNTVAYVVQFLAIGAIVFAGVRYMFASADAKADIKKQTVILIVGAVLVFAAVPVLKFVSSMVADINNGTV